MTPEYANPRSDRVKALARLSGRSARRRTGRFLVEGPQAVREALTAGAVHELWATPAALERHPELTPADGGITVRRCTDEVLQALSDTQSPQGVIAVAGLVDVPLDDVLARRPKLVAVLSNVRDPGNAGTVLRAADAAGADAVVFTGSSVDVHNPKCVRATTGSLFHLQVVTGVGYAQAVSALRSAGLATLAADVRGPVDLDDLLDDAAAGAGPLTGPHAWVFGNEAWGLSDEELAAADAGVRVPVYGHAESLNLATAAAVCLYAGGRSLLRPPGRSAAD